MKNGNWIKMDKALIKALPTTRPYTLIEAIYSYSVDLNNEYIGIGTIKSFREYARIWGWSTNKVIGLLRNKQATRTEQPKNTQGVVKFRLFDQLQDRSEQSGDAFATSSKGAGNITNKNKIKNKKISMHDSSSCKNKEEAFDEFWKLYPSRNGKKLHKKDALRIFMVLSNKDYERIYSAVKNYSLSKVVADGFAKDAVRFLKNDYWKDWIEPEKQDDTCSVINNSDGKKLKPFDRSEFHCQGCGDFHRTHDPTFKKCFEAEMKRRRELKKQH